MSEAWIVDVESGEKLRIEAGSDAFQGSWSPHGWRLAFCRLDRENRRQLFTVEANGGEPKVLVEASLGGTIWTPWWSPDGRHLYYSSSDSGVFNIGRIAIDEETCGPMCHRMGRT
ncbi:MAG: TolB family protein [Myxococcota bacterium]